MNDSRQQARIFCNDRQLASTLRELLGAQVAAQQALCEASEQSRQVGVQLEEAMPVTRARCFCRSGLARKLLRTGCRRVLGQGARPTTMPASITRICMRPDPGPLGGKRGQSHTARDGA